jgi:hypothetical protein
MSQTEQIIIAMGEREYPKEVAMSICEDDPVAYRRAASYLNYSGVDLLCVQHEFGIYGGPAGSYLVPLLRELRMPVVTTLHSVLRAPDIAQRKVMEELAQHSTRLVVMAERGAEILREVYDIDA